MIRHVILFKFYNEVSANDRKDAEESLRALGKNAPGVREWSIGRQFREVKKAHDIAEVASFDNEEALDAFRNHPEHIRVREMMSKISDWVAVDYEYNA